MDDRPVEALLALFLTGGGRFVRVVFDRRPVQPSEGSGGDDGNGGYDGSDGNDGGANTRPSSAVDPR